MIGTDFITAGRAVFTLVGKASRFTYRVSRKDPEPGSRYTTPTFFVSLLSGPDNTADYRYLGILDPVTGYVRLTRGSKLAPSAPSVQAIQWAFPRIWQHAPMPSSFQIHHEGRCGRCGRALTVPESITTGFGPECAGKLGIPMESEAKRAVSAKFAAAHGQTLAGPEHHAVPTTALFDVAFEA
jgi:hypothetical protein